MDFWILLATINYVFIDFIIAELVALAIEEKTRFNLTEWIVLLTLGSALALFFFSNILQEYIVSQIVKIKGWLFLTLLGLLSLSIFILTKLILGRRWGFRLVVISLISLIITIIIGSIKLILYFNK